MVDETEKKAQTGQTPMKESLPESEESFRRAFDYSSVGRLHAAMDGRFHRVNRAVCELTGYSEKELLQKSWQEMTHPDHLKGTIENMQRLFSGEVPSFEMDVRAIHKLGKDLWVHLNVVLIKGRHGLPLFMAGDVQDITYRKQAEEAVRDSEESYRAIFDTANDAIVIHDIKTGQFLDVNRKMCEMFGISREEALHLTVGDISSGKKPYTQEDAILLIRKAEEGHPQIFEWRCRTIDHRFFWAEVSLKKVVLRGKDRCLAIVRDIDDRKEAERVVMQERDRAQKYLDITGVIIVAIDSGQKVTLINKKGCETLGYSNKEIIGKNWFKNFLPENDRERTRSVFESLMVGEIEPVEHFENPVLTRNGDERIIRWHNTILTDSEENITGTLSSGEDVTEQKKAEEELRNSREQLRELTTHLQLAREEERSVIAREIHDELGQVLTALKIDLSWLEGRLSDAPDVVLGKIKSLLNLTDSTIQSVKRISTKLRPRLLDELGLVAAVEWQAEDFQRLTGVKCKIQVNPLEFLIDREISTAVFRILQESLRNVARHAEAKTVEILLAREKATLRLRVKDDGKGIQKQKVFSSSSFGILGMRERCHSLNGEIIIFGAAKRGTTVEAIIPVPEKE